MSAFAERARLLLGQQRADLALEQVRKGLAEAPDDGDLHFLHALCLHHLDREQEALDALAPALRAEPDASAVHWLRGECLIALRRHDEARTALEEARRLDPEDADVPGGLASLHVACARWEDALAAAEAGLRLDPEHTRCSNLRAFALSQLGRSDEAAGQAEAELARDPDNGWTHAQRGWALLNAGRHREAAESFREALRLEPGLEFARNGLVEALRARSPVYALFLRYFLLMGRLGKYVWLVVFGLVVGQMTLRSLAEAFPVWSWLFWGLYGLLLTFAVMTWFVRPLFNFTLWLHPIGRIALSKGERRQSLVFAFGLAVVMLAIVAAAADFFGGSWVPVIIAGSLLLPLVYLVEPRLGLRGRLAIAGLLVMLVGMVGYWGRCWYREEVLYGEMVQLAGDYGISNEDDLRDRLVAHAAWIKNKSENESVGEGSVPAPLWSRAQLWLRAQRNLARAYSYYMVLWSLIVIGCVFVARLRS